VKAEAANPNLRIAEKVTIGMMASVLLFILVAGGPIAVLCSAIVMAVPLVLLRRFIRGYKSSDFPLICGALAFASVVTGYILWFYITQELDAPRVAAAIVAGTAPPRAQAGLAGLFIPFIALFAGGVAYAVVALVSLAFHVLFTRRP
jgi:hypothetical protein